MAKARYMDIILLVSICRYLRIRSSGMLALLSQMSQSLSMNTCIHANMWVRIRGCLRVCDVHVCVVCSIYGPVRRWYVHFKKFYPVAVLGARGGFAPIAKSSPREAPPMSLEFYMPFCLSL